MGCCIEEHHRALACTLLALAALLLAACGSSSSSDRPDASGPPPDCAARCSSKAQQCGAPPDRATAECASLCPKVTSSAQLSCIEGSSCSDLMDLFEETGTVCGISSGTPTGGKFGGDCKCQPDSSSGAGSFECAGTHICESGLRCVGTRIQGVDHGKCRGPVCCNGRAECEQVLGQRGSCDAGQICSCTTGIECVGSTCTCSGGVPATEGLCYPG
ncbi:MAG: hypothetical protein ACTHU0_36915 [Kofleriaceae bacterium]